jgi:zinc transport system substrate-binding protein
MQPAVDEAVQENGPEHVLETTEVVPLEPAEEGHEGESPEEHAEHEHAAGDPHFWLDPARMVTLAGAVRDKLTEVDPDNADRYEANFEALRADLEALDRDYRKGLSRCSLDTVVVSHDAFSYLEKYGLHFESIAGLSPDMEPSPAHIAELQGLIRSDGVTTVFSETLASPAMARTIARDLGLETAVLDPVEGLGENTADEDYLSLMRANLSALQEANQCK